MGRILLYGDGLFCEMANKKLRPEGEWPSGGRALAKGDRRQGHHGPSECSGNSKGDWRGECVLRGGRVAVQSTLAFAVIFRLLL